MNIYQLEKEAHDLSTDLFKSLNLSPFDITETLHADKSVKFSNCPRCMGQCEKAGGLKDCDNCEFCGTSY